MINVFQPSVGDEEIAAVREVFASNWIGTGPVTDKFVAEFAAYVGLDPQRLLFTNSATAGLFLATELLELGPDDDVVLPSASFVANANAVVATGARPVFCDVDRRTLNPSADDIRRALTPRTRAVMVLHYGGYPGDIAEIAALCAQLGVALIEDVACSIASSVSGRRCGSFGDIAVWSFDSRKIMTTGDGGMLYVSDEALAGRARRLAYHGLEDRSAFTTATKTARRWWQLELEEPGRRSIGNDMTAAIGRVQLRRLPSFIARRREITRRYDWLLANTRGIETPPPLPAGHESSYYFYWVQIDAGLRDSVAERLLEHGIYTTFRYPPLHPIPLYRAEGELPGVTEAAERTLLLPIHQALSDSDVDTVAEALCATVDSCRASESPRS